MTLANLSIHYTWKNIKSQYNINKFQLRLGMILLICLMVLTQFLTFRTILSLSSKNTKLTENPPVQIYPNKIKNRIVLKIKIGYKLELLTPETMKLLGSTKKRC